MTPRILVTGSRDWDDVDRIRLALKMLREEPFFADAVLVHGAARGADQIAARVWKQEFGGIDEPHRAEWSKCVPECLHGPRPRKGNRTWCPSAGIRRNAHMVRLGADICLAFSRNGSSGTESCVTLARAKGIHTLVFDYDRPEAAPC